MPQLPRLYTTAEAAERLAVSTETLRRWAANGDIDSILLPSGQRRFKVEVVEAILSGETARPVEVA